MHIVLSLELDNSHVNRHQCERVKCTLISHVLFSSLHKCEARLYSFSLGFLSRCSSDAVDPIRSTVKRALQSWTGFLSRCHVVHSLVLGMR